MKLTILEVKSAKPKDKKYRLSDGGSLYLEVTPSGGKFWRMKYRYLRKEKLLSFGPFPLISIKEARTFRDDAKKLLLNDIDPSERKKQNKQKQLADAKNSFEVVARDWIEANRKKWAASNTKHVEARFDRYIYPKIGHRSIVDIKPHDILTIVKQVEKAGTVYTAHKIVQNCGQVFRYAISSSLIDSDPTYRMTGALQPIRHKHHASITNPNEIGGLLRAINGYEGNFITRCALKLAPLVIVRPGELRHAEWSEVDFDKAEWRLPADKMKMKTVHIVPLSEQAQTILKDLHVVTGEGKFIFPGIRSASRPMSENTLNAGLRRLGYTNEDMTAHGFRSMASTLLNEQGWHWDAIERQLAHAERNSIRAAYNYAEHMPERIKMLQHWADYLDGLANSANVVSIHHNAK